mmetsp:Transcript_59320/g.158863  ORF Transcript_59320/g.158863 Transcript_59320/m.158863 type:complete len:258 (+) Transcript_59320:3-776(+)
MMSFSCATANHRLMEVPPYCLLQESSLLHWDSHMNSSWIDHVVREHSGLVQPQGICIRRPTEVVKFSADNDMAWKPLQKLCRGMQAMESRVLAIETALPVRLVVLSAREPDVLPLHHAAVYELLEAAHSIIGSQHIIWEDPRDLEKNGLHQCALISCPQFECRDGGDKTSSRRGKEAQSRGVGTKLVAPRSSPLDSSDDIHHARRVFELGSGPEAHIHHHCLQGRGPRSALPQPNIVIAVHAYRCRAHKNRQCPLGA